MIHSYAEFLMHIFMHIFNAIFIFNMYQKFSYDLLII